MAEYIAIEELLAQLRAMESYNVSPMYRRGYDDCVATVLNAPAADVVPVVHGRWEGYTRSRYIGCDEYGDPRYVDGVVYYCSNPRCRRRTVIKERYCPSCGAKMDGGADNAAD